MDLEEILSSKMLKPDRSLLNWIRALTLSLLLKLPPKKKKKKKKKKNRTLILSMKFLSPEVAFLSL